MSHSPSEGDKCEPNLIPMLDLVLQLIMFFIVCVNFKQQDYNTKDVKLPVAQSARPLERSDYEPIFLNLNDKGAVLVPGREPLESRPAIRAYLKSEFDAAERVTKKGEKIKRVVIIRGHRAADYEKIYDLLRDCKDVGFSKLQLRAEQKASSEG